MPSGAMRPQTFTDVISVISGQQQSSMDASGPVTAIGNVVEANESVPAGETVTLTVITPTGWDNGVWGMGQWS